MRNPETNPTKIDRKSFCEFTKPEGGRIPRIRIIENRDRDIVEAQFALRLSGVDCRGKNGSDSPVNNLRGTTSMRYVASMFDGLRDSQSLEILCCTRRGLQSEWRIVGTASEQERGRSVEGAMSLFESVDAVLRTMRGEYQFAPVDDDREFQSAREDYPWFAVIEPAQVTVLEKNRKRMGFVDPGSGSGVQTRIVLPMPAGGRPLGYLDSLYSAASGGPENVRLALRVTPVKLDSKEQALIERALTVLKAGAQITCGINGGTEKDLGSWAEAERIIAVLKPWAEVPSGYRVHCAVGSDGPLPESLLSMIGREVFHGSQIRVTTVDTDGKRGSGSEIGRQCRGAALDLGGCFHKTAVPMPILPSARVLAETGFRRQYCAVMHTSASEGILLGSWGSDSGSGGVHYPPGDRARHCYVIGSSGTGKSTLLYNMIMQDIENSEGVAVIDPHGDLYTQILASIPERRHGDVVLVNPCDFEYAVGINFLECGNGPFRSVEMNFIINEFIRILDRIYDLKRVAGPVFEQYLRNAILLLLMDAGDPEEQATLIDVPRIFEDDDFRTSLISKCENQLVKNFWTKQALQVVGEGSLCNMGPYITSKLNQFTTNALLRPIIGQSVSTINFRSILDEGRILLVNLSKGLLGELDSQLLGMLIIGKIFSSAMSRVAVPVKQRRRVFLYVDEFQNFTTDTIAHLLSESRKFGICLTLANQNLSQLASGHGRNNVLDSVLGNVGTVLMFRMGVLDAGRMEPYVKPSFTAQDLQELPDFHAIARMLVNNLPQRPFVFNTIAASENSDPQDLSEIVDEWRKRCSRPTGEVEQQINERLVRNMRR